MLSERTDSQTVKETAARVLERCSELAGLTDEPGCITRSFLSPAMERVNARVRGWMEGAGLRTERDTVGNLIGTYPGGREDAPVLVLGSHLDTVRDAGAYDGVLGVLLGVAVCEEFAGAELPFDLEVVAFADEEGLRFGVPFLGSRGLIGELDAELLERRDEVGLSVADAIESWGGDLGELRCRYTGRRAIGYLEAHIEQGIWLDYRDLPLGVLRSISSASWLRLRFEGEARHAGTTPMELRRDALPAAAEVVLAAEQIALGQPDMVATVGKLHPSPGAGNVIPGRVELSLDIRTPDAERLAIAERQILRRCREIAGRRGLAFEHQVLNHQAGVVADGRLSRLLSESLADLGIPAGELALGAGHDALIMARRMPITMLLIRSPDGLSHHPDESVRPTDVETALAAMGAFVGRLARLDGSSLAVPVEDLVPA